MRHARRPLPFDPQHLQACPVVPLRKRRTNWRGNLAKGVVLHCRKARESGDSFKISKVGIWSSDETTHFLSWLQLNASSVAQTVCISDNHCVCIHLDLWKPQFQNNGIMVISEYHLNKTVLIYFYFFINNNIINKKCYICYTALKQWRFIIIIIIIIILYWYYYYIF